MPLLNKTQQKQTSKRSRATASFFVCKRFHKTLFVQESYKVNFAVELCKRAKTVFRKGYSHGKLAYCLFRASPSGGFAQKRGCFGEEKGVLCLTKRYA